jgi:hypothetical protein
MSQRRWVSVQRHVVYPAAERPYHPDQPFQRVDADSSRQEAILFTLIED